MHKFLFRFEMVAGMNELLNASSGIEENTEKFVIFFVPRKSHHSLLLFPIEVGGWPMGLMIGGVILSMKNMNPRRNYI